MAKATQEGNKTTRKTGERVLLENIVASAAGEATGEKGARIERVSEITERALRELRPGQILRAPGDIVKEPEARQTTKKRRKLPK